MEDIGEHPITSSSDYHQSNGLAENMYILQKSSLAKANYSVKNPHFAMMLCRNTSLGNGL